MEFTSELFSILFRFESDGRRGKKKSYGSGMEDFGILIPLSSVAFFCLGRGKKNKNKRKVNNSKHNRTLRESEGDRC